MKRNHSFLNMLGAALIGTTLSAGSVAFAQTSVSQTTTTTTNSSGTISEFSPTGTTIVMKTEHDSSPVTYSYSKKTVVVDESGNPVDVSIVKSGLPVTVYYTRDGDSMVASRIIVKKADADVVEKKTTTTTTTTGQ